MAERTNALVLKTRGGKTPEGSNPSAPAFRLLARAGDRLFSILLKIVKIIETFAFRFCTLWVPSQLEKRSAGHLRDRVDRRRTG
jgi:hypothetical protein